MNSVDFIPLSMQLDRAGLLWDPEIGDEVCERGALDRVAILVDPQGHTPEDLRKGFLWLPSVEQLVEQIGQRGGCLYHIGFSDQLTYDAVIHTPAGTIEVRAASLRSALAHSLLQLMDVQYRELVH